MVGRHWYWLRSFSGKHVVRSYARWFGVDLMCAAKKLQILGMRFSPEYLDALRRAAPGRLGHRCELAHGAETAEGEPMWNQEFVYIAGYTEAGLPFGVTWDEIEGLDSDDVSFTGDDFGKGGV